jgi:hypothetical protein
MKKKARDRFTPALELYARIEKNEGQKNNKKMRSNIYF